jgi:hypothetical protein
MSTGVSIDANTGLLGMSGVGTGVVGLSLEGTGVGGISFDGTGVVGISLQGQGVAGSSEFDEGVFGSGPLRGVRGVGQNPYNEPENTTGALGEGYEDSPGVIGLSFQSTLRGELGQAAGVIGASNADSVRDPNNPTKLLGAGVVGLSLTELPVAFDPSGILPLPNPSRVPDGRGTGVWGASGGGTGVHGESQSGRGGVFVSQQIAQLRLVPQFNPNPGLPAIGDWGDLYLAVVTAGREGTLEATMWLCVSPGDGTPGNAAQWAPFQFGPVVSGG